MSAPERDIADELAKLARSTRRDLVGRRIRLGHCADFYTLLQPGELGTVLFVDDVGTVHVHWDSGSSLGLIPGVDIWTVLP